MSEMFTNSDVPEEKANTGDEEKCAKDSSEKETVAENSGFTPPNPMSKNQLKKQKKLLQYEELRRARRLKEREREKQKRSDGIPRNGPSRKELKRHQEAASSNPAAIRVAIDLDYDELMQDRDVAKCVKQCLRIYTINRRSQQPCQLHLTGIKKDGRIHGALKKNDGWENWHLQYHFDETHVTAFSKEELIYLTCESDAVLEHLDPKHVYVIGGLVDHNHHKGLCHERATKVGLHTARLPLSEHVDMKTRSVLSTFHVFEILVRLAEGKTWTEAIMNTLPVRKGAVAKAQTTKIKLNSTDSANPSAKGPGKESCTNGKEVETEDSGV